MIEFLPGFERRLRGNNGGYETAGPWTLLLHTTEGGLLGSIGTLDARNVWPQLLVDFELGRRIQAYPLSMPGRSLADRSGGVFTNRRGRVIQVEIVGFARQSHLWGDGAYRFLADVLRPVFDGGVGAHGPRFYGEGEGLLASPNAHQRFPFGVWNTFGGVCGHQHAPENDHWDPGRFDLARFLRFVGGASAPAIDWAAIVAFLAALDEEERRRAMAGPAAFDMGGFIQVQHIDEAGDWRHYWNTDWRSGEGALAGPHADTSKGRTTKKCKPGADITWFKGAGGVPNRVDGFVQSADDTCIVHVYFRPEWGWRSDTIG